MLMDLCQKQLTWLSWLDKYQYITCKGLRSVFIPGSKILFIDTFAKGNENKHTEYLLKKNKT